MRLLFVSHSFPPADQPMANIGGMQRVATELAEALCAHADVSLLVMRGRWKGIHLRCACWMVPTLFRIWRRVRRQEIDAVLFSSMVTASLGLLLQHTLRRAGVTMAAIAHGKDVTQAGPYQWLLVRRILRAMDRVLPVSRATGAACAARGLPSSRIHVVPNGVKASRFASVKPAAERQDHLLLCSVGRLVRRKGFAWFVRQVMPRLPHSVQYHIAGDGPERRRIEEAIETTHARGRVQLLGRVSEEALCALYGAADLLVMPNIPVPGDMEGFGVVMLEAGACGVPAVAARLEGIQDVITENINGHLVRVRSAAAFAEVILRYESDRRALQALQRRAKHHTTATFAWPSLAKRYIRALAPPMPRPRGEIAADSRGPLS